MQDVSCKIIHGLYNDALGLDTENYKEKLEVHENMKGGTHMGEGNDNYI